MKHPLSALDSRDKEVDEPTTLIIRHMPDEFLDEDKIDFLKYLGAKHVKCFEKIPLKNCVFATFDSHEQCKEVLQTLHQFKLFGRRLSVEYSKSVYRNYHPSEDTPIVPSSSDGKRASSQTEIIDSERRDWVNQLLALAPRWGINHQLRRLCYAYPTPTPMVLTNIARAMAACPALYNQVLHLMNKMNLPAPFGSSVHFPGTIDLTNQQPELSVATQEMDVSSGDESELSSESEQTSTSKKRYRPHKTSGRSSELPRPSKIPKSYITANPSLPLDAPIHEPLPITDVFDQQPALGLAANIQLQIPKTTRHVRSRKNVNSGVEEVLGGFGTMEPVAPPPISDSQLTSNPGSFSMTDLIEDTPDTINVIDQGPRFVSKVTAEPAVDETEDLPVKPDGVISLEELGQGRVSEEQMKELPVFRRYEPGEPSSRLYVKNLGKGVTEGDIGRIYARFVDWNSSEERRVFNVKLLTEGRMKGQAFITLGSDSSAKEALSLTNGFVLESKPMVVQFARGAKAKVDERSFLVKNS